MTIEELQRCKQHLTEESQRVIDSIQKSQRILDYWKNEIEQIDKLLENGTDGENFQGGRELQTKPWNNQEGF